MATSVTHDDLLDALRAALASAPSSGGDGYTSAELQELMQCGPDKVRKLLHQLKRNGALDTVRLSREAIDGRQQTIIGYRLKAEPPKAKKK